MSQHPGVIRCTRGHKERTWNVFVAARVLPLYILSKTVFLDELCVVAMHIKRRVGYRHVPALFCIMEPWLVISVAPEHVVISVNCEYLREVYPSILGVSF